jgi:hypothetical protein
MALQTSGRPDSLTAAEEVLDDNRRTREVGDGAIPSMPAGSDARSSVAGEVGDRR